MMMLRDWVRSTVKGTVESLARALSPNRERLFLDLSYALVDFVRGRTTSRTKSPPTIEVVPLDDEMTWPEPPSYERGVIGELDHSPKANHLFDVALIDELNNEYESRRLVPKAPSYAPSARNMTAISRIKGAHKQVGLAGKSVLEIGCSEGHLVWFLGNALDCEAHGVDVVEQLSWQSFAGDSVQFERSDLTVRNPYPEATFDRVLSYAVWEHLEHPYAMLEQAFKVLKPGGLALITANLFAGPKASHRYREIYFPWPHLLFSDATIRAWDMQHGRPPRGASWVNRLSWAQYESYLDEIGFMVRKVSFRTTEIDQEFYKRFEDILGRYPRRDLERDFFTVLVQKPSI